MYIQFIDVSILFLCSLRAGQSFSQRIRNYTIAFYQTQRNAFVVIITLLLSLYILTVPDQAADMINAVMDGGVFNGLFQYILLSTFVWSWLVYGSTRMILHISPVGLRINEECDRLLRWLPKLGGMIPALILAYAFWKPDRLQPYLLLLLSGLMLALVPTGRAISSRFCPACSLAIFGSLHQLFAGYSRLVATPAGAIGYPDGRLS